MTPQPHQFYFNERGPFPFLFEVGYELGDRQCVATHETREGAHELALAMFGVVETPPLMEALDVGRAGVPGDGTPSPRVVPGRPLVAHKGVSRSRSPSVRAKVVA